MTSEIRGLAVVGGSGDQHFRVSRVGCVQLEIYLRCYILMK